MRYTERELLEKDIIKVDDNNYLVGDVKINTNEEYYNDGCNGIKEIDLSKFQVSDNDTVVITRYKDNETKWNLLITNCDKPSGTEGFAYYGYSQYGMSDDTRFDITDYIAEQIRQMGVKNVLVAFYLWYTEEEVEDYMERFKEFE